MEFELTNGTSGARVTVEIAQSIEKNSSSVAFSKLELKCQSYNSVWVVGYVKIGGITVLDMKLGSSGNGCAIGPNYSAVNLANCTKNTAVIAHEADGTKRVEAQVDVSLYVSRGTGNPLGHWTDIRVSGEAELPTIPRASTITLSPNPVEMGKKLAIDIHRASAGFTHRLYYTFGSKSRVLIEANAGGSYAWTVPDLVSEIPGKLSGKCTVTCETCSGGAVIGSSAAEVTLNVPSARAPEGSLQLTCGTAGTITYRRSSAAYTVRVEYRFNGASGVVAEGMRDSFGWTPPYDLAKRIPALTVGMGTFTYTILNGTAVVGSFEQVFRLTVPENDVTRPIFPASGLTLTKITSLTGQLGELWIRGKTGIQAAMDASSEYSKIAGYNFSVGSARAQGNPAVIGLLADDGEVAYTAKVTDAGGSAGR